MYLYQGSENVVQILESGTQGQVPQSLMRTVSCRQGASEAGSASADLREEHGESSTTLIFVVRTMTQMHVSHSFSLPFLWPGKVLMICWCLGDANDNTSSIYRRQGNKRFPLITVHIGLVLGNLIRDEEKRHD